MTDDGPSSHEALLEQWLDDLPLLVERLERVHLQRPLDYGPASLTALERALIDQVGGVDEEFVRAAAAYVGEVLMGAGGGRWDVEVRRPPGRARAADPEQDDPEQDDPEQDDPEHGDPVVRPDRALGLEPLPVTVLVEVALAERSGEVFAREHARLTDAADRLRAAEPGWQPHKERSPLDPLGPQPQDPWLTAWLRDREAAFPAWSAAAAGPWDFSPASLDRLEQQVRARYPTTADFDADCDGPFLTGALWYLGEVICRHRDAVWLYWSKDPDADPGSHYHPHNPWSGIPFTHQPHRRDALPIDPHTQLRALIRYGPRYHLRTALPPAR